MSSSAEILQEYLVSLGFKTDAISLRKFDDSLGATGKRVLGVGTAVAGVVASVEAAAAAFAYNMRKMYFASELADSSVKNLRSMEFAGKQLGISGDAMASSIHGMAQAMRLNPGLQALVESFGIRVTGRDVSDVMLDYVTAIQKMPEFVGSQYAGLFGIDPDTYHQMISHLDELKKKKQENLEMYKQMGYDPDAFKKTILEYTTGLDKLESKLGMFAGNWLKAVAPAFQMTTDWLLKLIDLTNFIAGGEFGAGIGKILHMWINEGQFYEKGSRLDEFLHRSEKREAESKRRRTATGKITPLTQAPPTVVTPEQSKVPTAGQVVAELEKLGWTKEQSIGITANLQRESGLNPQVPGDYNPKTGKFSAHGLAQWHPDRQQNFREFAGKDIRQSSWQEQVAFLNYELRQGKEQRAGQKIEQAKTPQETARLVSREALRPGVTEAAKTSEAETRANMAGALLAQLGKPSPSVKESSPAMPRETARKPEMTYTQYAPSPVTSEPRVPKAIQPFVVNIRPNLASQVQGAQPGQQLAQPPNPVENTNIARLGQSNVTNVQFSNTTQITVHGNEPTSTAKEVERAQTRVFGDAVRNLKGSVS